MGHLLGLLRHAVDRSACFGVQSVAIPLRTFPFCEANMAQCEERERLQDEYIKAVNAYGEAVSRAKSPKTSGQISARQMTRDCARLCEKTLNAFADHLDQHGCAAMVSNL